MKTLILYATKYGATHEIAERIAKRIPGAILHNLKQASIPALTDFGCVIIGSSIYGGSIRKEAKAFLAQNMDILKEKDIGLFLCGLRAEEENQYFASNFPPDILTAAKSASFLGGIFDPQKAGFLERLIIKAATKLPGYIDRIDDERIEQFVDKYLG